MWNKYEYAPEDENACKHDAREPRISPRSECFHEMFEWSEEGSEGGRVKGVKGVEGAYVCCCVRFGRHPLEDAGVDPLVTVMLLPKALLA